MQPPPPTGQQQQQAQSAPQHQPPPQASQQPLAQAQYPANIIHMMTVSHIFSTIFVIEVRVFLEQYNFKNTIWFSFKIPYNCTLRSGCEHEITGDLKRKWKILPWKLLLSEHTDFKRNKIKTVRNQKLAFYNVNLQQIWTLKKKFYSGFHTVHSAPWNKKKC